MRLVLTGTVLQKTLNSQAPEMPDLHSDTCTSEVMHAFLNNINILSKIKMLIKKLDFRIYTRLNNIYKKQQLIG